MWATKQKQPGFTLVELIIVIVIIGILASITMVAFNGVQQRARDAQRQSDFAAISKALVMYYADNGNYVASGGGSGNGDGWFNGGSPSVLTTLQNAGYLTGSNLRDPKCGNSGHQAGVCSGYLKANCGTGADTRTYLFARLESQPNASLPAEMADCGAAQRGWWTSYSSNYYVRVQ